AAVQAIAISGWACLTAAHPCTGKFPRNEARQRLENAFRSRGLPSEIWPRNRTAPRRRRRGCETHYRLPGLRVEENCREVREHKNRRMNTKHVEDRAERKKLKRQARKKAAPKQKRASGVARGSTKRKVRKMVK